MLRLQLHILIFICCGAVAFAAESATEGLMEDELMDEFAFLEESGVVESATRHKQEIGMSPSAITVITREDIEASGANTVADLLRPASMRPSTSQYQLYVDSTTTPVILSLNGSNPFRTTPRSFGMRFSKTALSS